MSSALLDFKIQSLKFKTTFFLAVFGLFLFLPNFTYAQTLPTSAIPAPSPSYAPLPANLSPQSPEYANLMVFNFMHALSCIASGHSFVGPCIEYQLSKDIQGKVISVPVLASINTTGGLLGVTSSLVSTLLVTSPIKTSDYLIGMQEQFGIVKEAHAQVGGSGNGILSPVFKLWEVSRNLSYIIMILIFVAVGLMVMFRQKVNPQTVISIQLALPGLIVGLVLITFSYFLASLLTDTAFVGVNFVGYYFSLAQGGGTSQNLLSEISDQNTLSLFSKFVGIIKREDVTPALQTVFSSVSPQVQIFLRMAAGVMAFQQGNLLGHAIPVVGDLAGIVAGLLAAGVSAAAAPQVFGQIVAWLAIGILIYTMFKLLMRLINNYLQVIFLTISAPFTFLAASLPGRQGMVTDWIRNMLCNVLAFPAVIAVFYFVAFLVNLNTPPFNISQPLSVTGGGTFPLFGGMNVSFINILLAFGALIATPAIPDVICKAIGKVGQSSQMLSQEISGNMRTGQGYNNQNIQRGQQTASRISQDYNHFRGADPGYSPAENVNIFGRNLGEFAPFGGQPGSWRGWRPFGKKAANG